MLSRLLCDTIPPRAGGPFRLLAIERKNPFPEWKRTIQDLFGPESLRMAAKALQRKIFVLIETMYGDRKGFAIYKPQSKVHAGGQFLSAKEHACTGKEWEDELRQDRIEAEATSSPLPIVMKFTNEHCDSLRFRTLNEPSSLANVTGTSLAKHLQGSERSKSEFKTDRSGQFDSEPVAEDPMEDSDNSSLGDPNVSLKKSKTLSRRLAIEGDSMQKRRDLERTLQEHWEGFQEQWKQEAKFPFPLLSSNHGVIEEGLKRPAHRTDQAETRVWITSWFDRIATATTKQQRAALLKSKEDWTTLGKIKYGGLEVLRLCHPTQQEKLSRYTICAVVYEEELQTFRSSDAEDPDNLYEAIEDFCAVLKQTKELKAAFKSGEELSEWKKDHVPTRYDIQIGTGNITQADWEDRLQKLRTRLLIATKVSNSVVGRVFILNSVLLPSILFTAGYTKPPAKVVDQLVNLQKQFLWKSTLGTDGTRHKVSPSLLYLPVKERGGIDQAFNLFLPHIASRTAPPGQRSLLWELEKRFGFIASEHSTALQELWFIVTSSIPVLLWRARVEIVHERQHVIIEDSTQRVWTACVMQVRAVAHRMRTLKGEKINAICLSQLLSVLERQDMSRQLEAWATTRLYFDGGARGNPGPGGSGWAIILLNERSNRWELKACGYAYMGPEVTDNWCGYSALKDGLAHSAHYLQHYEVKLEAFGDSQMMIAS
ncbi:hypothetical protein FI667_g12319, partial [Globisporangium splendens]